MVLSVGRAQQGSFVSKLRTGERSGAGHKKSPGLEATFRREPIN
jgi:hypothetical protein